MKFDENSLYYITTKLLGKRHSLFDLAKWKNGLAFRKIDFSDKGLPVIKIAELNNGITASTSFTQGKYSEEVFLTKGDMVFSWSGNPQTSIDVFRYNLQDGWLNQHIFKVVANEDIVDKEYLYYVLKYLKLNFTQIATNKQTTGLGHVTLSDIKRISVVVPNNSVQKSIVGILKAIDDKILLNNAINDNLLQQAQAIFKSWFVEFEPHNGVIPSDWRISTLAETTEMSAGGDKPKILSMTKSRECPYPVYSNGLLDEGLYGYTNIPKIKDESVTVSARGTIGFICLRHIPYVPIVRLITLIPNTALISAKYLYLYLKQLHISGTGTTQQQLTVPDFKKTEILIPSKDMMDRFSTIVTPMFNSIWYHQEQNEKLIALRDSLLPKLISGELDVSEI